MSFGRKLGWVESPERARGSINDVTEPPVSQRIGSAAPSPSAETGFDSHPTSPEQGPCRGAPLVTLEATLVASRSRTDSQRPTDTEAPTDSPTDSDERFHSPEHLDRRARAGRSIRDIGHALIGHHVEDDLVDDLIIALDAVTAQLAAGPTRSRRPGSFQRGDDWGADDDQTEFTGFDDRPVSGRSSPWGLDPVVRRSGNEIEATVTLRAAHEGAPGRSHGGVVSALFDDVFGFVLITTRTPGFTGELTVRYEGGTPLHVPLICRARLAAREGRKLFMTGELITPGGEVCVRSKATFITIDPTAFPGWGDGV